MDYVAKYDFIFCSYMLHVKVHKISSNVCGRWDELQKGVLIWNGF